MGITGISTSGGVSLGQETRLAGASGHARFSNWSGTPSIASTPDNVSLDILGRDHFNPVLARPQELYQDTIYGPTSNYRYLAISGVNCTVNITYPTNVAGWRIVSGTGTSATSTNTLGYPTNSGAHEELQYRAIKTGTYSNVSMNAASFAYGTTFNGWYWCGSDWVTTGGPVSFSTSFTLYNNQATGTSYTRLKAVCS